MKLDCSELGMVMTIVKTADDTQGRSLEMEWTLSPRSGQTIQTKSFLCGLHYS